MPGQFVDSIINENLKVATEYFKATVASYQEDVNKKIKDSGGIIGFIPFKMSCILDGISGIKIYNELNVNTNFLPNGYTKTTKFIVTGVDHKLSNGDWETSLNLTLIPNASNIGIITREIVLAERNKEVKKEIILAPTNNDDGKTSDSDSNPKEYKTANCDDLENSFNFALIPDGKGTNYRSAQIPEGCLEEVIKKYNIKNIIRMNGGENSDNNHKSKYKPLTKAEEEAICKNLGVSYNYVDAHSGTKENETGYDKSSSKATTILLKGNTLIHCAHGADRTGAMVGNYLKTTGKETDLDKLWEYTTKFNSWDDLLKKGTLFGSGFDKYLFTFYPKSLFKKSKWVKKD